MAAEIPKTVWGFAADAETHNVFSESLAKPDMTTSRGSINDAVDRLSRSPSPRLVIVDLDGSDFPVGKVHDLAEVCEFGTRVIAVGSEDSGRLVRELIEAGVADYIPKPVSVHELVESIHSALDDEPSTASTRAGRVLSFVGCGGGVGTTTLAALVARHAAERGNWVSVLEMDRIHGPLSLMLDVVPAAGLGELLEEVSKKKPTTDVLDTIAATCGNRIAFFGYRNQTGKDWPIPKSDSVGWLVDRLGNRSHLTLVDGLSDWETEQNLLTFADQRILVLESTLVSISRAVRLLESVDREHGVILVQNQSRTHKRSLSPAQVKEALAGRAPDIVLPFEPGLPSATDHGWSERALGKKFRAGLDKLLDELSASRRSAEQST